MATVRWLYGQTNPVMVPFGASQVLTVGDVCAIDASGNLYRAEDETWNTDEATTRAAFITKFAGITGQSKRTGDTKPYGNSANLARVDTLGVFEADLDTATTLIAGVDLVGPAKAAGNALLSQTVKKVTSSGETHAIGTVVEGGTNLTRVKFSLRSTKFLASK